MNNDPVFEILESLRGALDEAVECADLNEVAASLSLGNPSRFGVFEALISACEEVVDVKLQDLICASIFSILIEDPVDPMWIDAMMRVMVNPGLSWIIAMSYKFDPDSLHFHYCLANGRDKWGLPQ